MMPIEVKEFKSGRLVYHQIVREDDPESYLDQRFEIFNGRFGLQVKRRPKMLVLKRLIKDIKVRWKKVETDDPVWSFGDYWFHYYPVDNGICWRSETTLYKAIS